MSNSSDAQKTIWVYYYALCIGSITCVLLLVVIISYLFCTKERGVKFELIFYLSISCLLTTIGYKIPWKTNKDLKDANCMAQSVLMTTFEISEFIFAMIIGYHLKRTIINNQGDIEHLKKWKRALILFFGFIFPSIFTLVTYPCGYLGSAGFWCWVIEKKGENDPYSKVFQWIAYGIMYISSFTNLYFACAIVCNFFRDHSMNKEQKKKYKFIVLKMLRYPLIQMICFLPGFLHRVFLSSNSTIPIISMIGMSSQAFLMLMAYVFSRETVYHLKTILCCEKKDINASARLNTSIPEEEIGDISVEFMK